MISIVMADDHPMIREGIRSMIERYANLKVLGEASGGAQALELVERLQPDVLLLDLRMPDMDGPEVTREARRISPRTRVLILTTYDTDRDILAAIEAGAGGYVLKDIEPARLAEAIRATAGGRTVLDQRASRGCGQQDAGRKPGGRPVGAGGTGALAGRRRQDQSADRQDPQPRRDHCENVFLAHLRQARRRGPDVGRRGGHEEGDHPQSGRPGLIGVPDRGRR